MKKLLPFSMSFLIIASVAASLPFLVVYFQSQGLNGPQIGVLAAIGPIITTISIPFWTSLADARSKHRLLLGLVLAGTAAALLVLPFLSSFLPIFIVLVVHSFFFGPVNSFSDSAAMFTLDNERHLYGRIRLGGTIGFAAMAAIAGVLVQNYGLPIAFWSASLLLITAALLSLKLKYPPPHPAKAPRASSLVLLRNPRWKLFLLAAFAGGLAFSAYLNFLFVYLRQLGASESVIGFTFTIGTIAEIPILFFGSQLVRRFGAFNLVLLSTAIAGARFLLFGMANTVEPIMWLQLLNGLTSPAMWIGAVAFADEAAPPGLSATAQGHLGTMAFGVGPAVGGFIGGLLLGTAGGHAVYYFFGATILAIVAVATLAWRYQSPKPAKQN